MAPTSNSMGAAAVAAGSLPRLLYCAVFLLQLCAICSAVRPKHFAGNRRTGAKAASANGTERWWPAVVTWYGPPDGAGSFGGACGYGAAVGRPPFSSRVAAGSASLFLAGKGCGACYHVRCTDNVACSDKPVRVVITDECLGGPPTPDPFHFDLSGTAVGAMARPGFEDQLRRAVGVLPVEFTRVPCEYPGRNVAFRVDAGANPHYFSVLIEFEDGNGELSGVALKDIGDTEWRSLGESWGAVWKLASGPELRPPLSIRLTSGHPARTLVARDVIPVGWKPSVTYRSLVNFE